MATQEEIDRAIRLLKETFLMAVHDYDFKGGVFKKQITRDTKTLDDFDVLITFSPLSKGEKAKFSKARAHTVKLLTTSLQMTSWGLSKDMLSLSKPLTDIFEEDIEKRAIYFPPMMIQKTDGKGSVVKTFEVTHEGVKTTVGGEAGVHPSAPEEIKKQERAAAAKEGLLKNNEKPVSSDEGELTNSQMCGIRLN
jgi:hypothetical protein